MPTTVENQGRVNNSNNSGPFTAAEDLQLLLAIQRYGTSGGRIGDGGGVGVGSWALVAVSLQHRSVRSCQRRYMELCDQFQPWSYSEDRKLYGILLKNEKEWMRRSLRDVCK